MTQFVSNIRTLVGALTAHNFIALLLLTSCLASDEPFSESLTIQYSWESGYEGWTVGYADYPAGISQQDSLQLYAMSYGHESLPSVITPPQKGIRLAGANRSDDLFMYLYAPVTGLAPNMDYELYFDLTLASNAPTNAIGIGGAPGEAVTLKAGAVLEKPSLTVTDGWYRMKLDKGNQSVAGEDMIAIGNIGVADDTKDYALIVRKNVIPFTVRTSIDGTLWLILGSDSGFEGLTALYYADLKVVFKRKS